MSSAFLGRLEQAVQREAQRFNVTRSFVIATAVAATLGVSEQPDYMQRGGR